MVFHLFGVKSSPSCAGFARYKTVEDNQQDHVPRVAKMVNDNFYFDDCLDQCLQFEKEGRLSHNCVKC
ncbi:hypothetical protein HOLleu_22480 [Holothuria leucospilota]|uniref:Uncharacterized protein n=1 Tax=Holothuria leucospilota TaxID=206669 RepID=A0A9Q1BZ72_HOLLE|nr:hypothetical protein HOLleu_22480 [Holothuria leucospilota]